MVNRILPFVVVGCLLPGLSISQQFSPRYELAKMGPEVNTKTYHEMSPVISTDGKKLYFVAGNRPDNTYGTDNSQDIWVTSLDEKGQWSPAKRMTSPLNQNRYNCVFNVLPDGSLFVRGGRGKNSHGFSIVSPSGSWSELDIPDFEKMDKGTFNGGTISADAKHVIMYFSEIIKSKRSDLYISNLQADGKWTRPVKLAISTTADEFGPFIGPDQASLFFASDRIVPGHIGGTDIYAVKRLDDTWMNWGVPVNLGKGVNTTAGDGYFSMDAQGNVFTCRMGSLVDGGNYDIFILKPRDIKITLNCVVQNEKTQAPIVTNAVLTLKDQKPSTFKTDAAGKFETRIPEIDSYKISAAAPGFFPKEQNFKIPKLNNDTTLRIVISLTPVIKRIVLSGNILDKKTNQPVNAKLEITFKHATLSTLQAEGGKYEQEISGVGKYVFAASAEGYLNGTDSVTSTNPDETPIRKDILLSPIEVGATVRLQNIYFDYDKTTLKSESFVELNKVVDFLKLNPHVEIEISGHTDSKGPDDYNLNLSQGRSQSVVNYLVTQGIVESRLIARGYGESKPIDTNDTDAGRANNRRVEFIVLKK